MTIFLMSEWKNSLNKKIEIIRTTSSDCRTNYNFVQIAAPHLQEYKYSTSTDRSALQAMRELIRRCLPLILLPLESKLYTCTQALTFSFRVPCFILICGLNMPVRFLLSLGYFMARE